MSKEEKKVIEVQGERFSAKYLRETSKKIILKQLKHIDVKVVEEAYNIANGVKTKAKK